MDSAQITYGISDGLHGKSLGTNSLREGSQTGSDVSAKEAKIPVTTIGKPSSKVSVQFEDTISLSGLSVRSNTIGSVNDVARTIKGIHHNISGNRSIDYGNTSASTLLQSRLDSRGSATATALSDMSIDDRENLLVGGMVVSSAFRDRWSGKVSNFSIQYNLACASVAILMIESSSDYPQRTETEKVLLLAMIFIGNVCGMLTMGYLGDKIGVARALCVTTGIAFVSQMGVAFLTWGSSMFTIFTLFRFLLGIGVGGLYPLSAAQAAQEAQKNQNIGGKKSSELQLRERSEAIGWNFFWQQPGNVSPYAVGLLMLGATESVSSQFRITIALGCVPLLTVYVWNLQKAREEAASRANSSEALTQGVPILGTNNELLPRDGANDGEKGTRGRVGEMSTCASSSSEGSQQISSPHTDNPFFDPSNVSNPYKNLKSWYNIKTQIGTGGTWFLFDVAYYGTQVFTPFIVGDIFGQEASLKTKLCSSIISLLFQIPGTILGIRYMRQTNPKQLNSHGFIAMGSMFLLLAVAKYTMPLAIMLHYCIFCILMMSLGFGCILATYVLPTLVFDESIRGTMHGISAGSGKAGAAVGAFLFPIINKDLGADGLPVLMAIQFFVCGIGWICNELFVPWPVPFLGYDTTPSPSNAHGGSFKDREEGAQE